MRYGFPPDFDIFQATGSLLYSAFVLHTQSNLLGAYRLDDFLVPLMVLPIALGPVIYAMIVGRHGLLTFAVGFLGGYYIWYFRQTFSFEILLIALATVVIGVIIMIYARTR
ncbi:MAG: hypothetical protein QHG99_00355 [Methanomicrobiales archaeon]|nr:hypothetical protein [Methanomicrobiales archaeon]